MEELFIWSLCNVKISYVARKDEHVASRYDVFNRKVEYVNGW